MALVLIADDSPTDQHVLARALENHGFETLIARDGQEAIRLAGERSPDVILMDINLGGMDGIECVQRLTTLMPNAQVMMLTVFEDTEKIFRVAPAQCRLIRRHIQRTHRAHLRHAHHFHGVDAFGAGVDAARGLRANF